MSDAELRDQLMTLLMAGHETTATGARVGIRPAVPRPAASSSACGRSSAEGGHEYLDAVIEETLRLRPVVPFVGRELRVPAELGGYELPEGTVVMPAIYLAHTRRDSYPGSVRFRPERFLDGGPETYSWIPFGGGTRRCIGAAFAQLEMRVVLRTVLGTAELRPATDAPRADGPSQRHAVAAQRDPGGAGRAAPGSPDGDNRLSR